jgi:predicted alpha-1,2-mannosidase
MPMHEAGESNEWHYLSPHSGSVRTGKLFTNNGFWDVARTVYPLLELIDPGGYGEIVDGFLSHYREGGWLPEWCSPGYTSCMVGTYSDLVVAEAICRGIGGFDREEAYAAIRKNAFEAPPAAGAPYGRTALDEYVRLGYVPADSIVKSVSWTLDNALCDYAVAQAATCMRRSDDAEILLQRATNYRQLVHKKSRFFRPRTADGAWVEPWSPIAWGGAYVEGGPWQFAFTVPHDPQGLADLHGGVDALVDRLGGMLSAAPEYDAGTYGQEIHEMTEMAFAYDGEGSFGQYAHSNQPVHTFLWLPAQLGRPELTNRWVTRVMRGLYSPDRFPGDEDNGEMAAWYVLGALGKAPAPAGSGRMVDYGIAVTRHVSGSALQC